MAIITESFPDESFTADLAVTVSACAQGSCDSPHCVQSSESCSSSLAAVPLQTTCRFIMKTRQNDQMWFSVSVFCELLMLNQLVFLGVLMMEKLSWKLHISQITSKIAKKNQNLGIIGKIQHLLNTEVSLNRYCFHDLSLGVTATLLGLTLIKLNCNQF